MISLQEHARLGNFRLGGEPPRPPSRLLLEFVIHLWYQSNYNFVIHMRKSKIISVRVPVDVLKRLDVLLMGERWCNRSDVICSLLEIATDTLMAKQLEALTHASEYWGNPVTELHIKYMKYGKPQSVDYVRESQDSTDV